MSERARGVAALAAWVAFLAAALVGLHALGRGPLSAPPVGHPGEWVSDRGAVTAVFALLRLALLGTGWYLLVWTLLATALRSVRADATAAAVEAAGPAPVRRLVRAAAGLSLAASVVAVSGAAASEPDAVVTMRRLLDTPSAVVDGGDAPPTMTRLPDVAAATHMPDLPEEPLPTTWTVAPGEHLWSIAARHLERTWGTTPTDRQVDPYWRAVIEVNRHRLPIPANPDFIVPALELTMPTPPLPPRPDV